MLVYYIQVSIGEWEDTFTFTYKELYFTSLEKAESIKAILDTINQVWVDVLTADNPEGNISGSNGFKPLIKLDARFNYGSWYEVPTISLLKKHITII